MVDWKLFKQVADNTGLRGPNEWINFLAIIKGKHYWLAYSIPEHRLAGSADMKRLDGTQYADAIIATIKEICE